MGCKGIGRIDCRLDWGWVVGTGVVVDVVVVVVEIVVVEIVVVVVVVGVVVVVVGRLNCGCWCLVVDCEKVDRIGWGLSRRMGWGL